MNPINSHKSPLIYLIFTLTYSSILCANVQILNFTDFRSTTSSNPNTIEFIEDLCVFNSQGTNYQLTIHGQQNTYSLINENGNTIPYQVYWYSTQGAIGPGFQMNFNQPEVFSGASQTSNCNGVNNSTVKIVIAQADLSNVLAGTYNDSLVFDIQNQGN